MGGFWSGLVSESEGSYFLVLEKYQNVLLDTRCHWVLTSIIFELLEFYSWARDENWCDYFLME